MTTASSTELKQSTTNFSEAINSFFKNFAIFSGRANRTEFIYAHVFVTALFIITGFISGLLSQSYPDAKQLLLLPILAMVIPLTSLTARRFHDMDRSGWWQLMSIVTLVYFVMMPLLCILKGTDGKNRFDS